MNCKQFGRGINCKTNVYFKVRAYHHPSFYFQINIKTKALACNGIERNERLMKKNNAGDKIRGQTDIKA